MFNSLSLKESSSNSDSVKALRLQRHRASTQAESLLRSTGQSSGSFMGNGSQRTSQVGTFCGRWICRLILSIAVCVSMRFATTLPSQSQLDILLNERKRISEPSTLTDEKAPSQKRSKRVLCG